MYLVTIEGGDGTGKGLAARMLGELAQQEFTFTGIEHTCEPRPHHPLGKLALDAVRTGEAGPVAEAGLFAADRLDHSHSLIRPLLEAGNLVICDRNVHSSLVYQGLVGGVGLEEVSRMNSAAMLPDLVLWIDCDSSVALRRIEHGTLRMSTLDKGEYFETDELQLRIRQGYTDLLSGKLDSPAPFDACRIMGPIMNEGSLDELETELRDAIRRFIHQRPTPLNVDTEVVEWGQLELALKARRGQQTLDVLAAPAGRGISDWLDDKTPWRVLQTGFDLYTKACADAPSGQRHDVPRNPLSHTVISIVGTLSLLPGVEVSELRRRLGPVRAVTARHTQRMLKFLHEQSGWVRRHKALVSRTEAPRSELRSDWQAYGRLGLAIWPLKERLSEWREQNPTQSWRNALSQLGSKKPSPELGLALDACIKRLQLLGSGCKKVVPPTDRDEFRRWWRDGPPQN